MAEIVGDLGIDAVELVAALEQALARQDGDDDGALTVRDLVQETGWTRTAILRGMRSLKEAGALEVIKVFREDLSGRVTRVPAYRLRQGA